MGYHGLDDFFEMVSMWAPLQASTRASASSSAPTWKRRGNLLAIISASDHGGIVQNTSVRDYVMTLRSGLL